MAKLTRDDAVLIRELHSVHGVSMRAIAEKFEVSSTAIFKVVNLETHVNFIKRKRRYNR